MDISDSDAGGKHIARQDLMTRPSNYGTLINLKASKLLENTSGMLIMENDAVKALSVQLGCAADDTLHKPNIQPPSIQELDLSLPDVQSGTPTLTTAEGEALAKCQHQSSGLFPLSARAPHLPSTYTPYSSFYPLYGYPSWYLENIWHWCAYVGIVSEHQRRGARKSCRR